MIRIITALALWLAAAAQAAPAPVVVVTVTGAIGPASADFVSQGLKRAEKQGAQLVVLQMDTPGGLDTSMRQIIKGILASPVPVAAYVAPGGARAASAGTYILYAAHIAAMAPGTNLGAATPVQIGGPPGGQPEKIRDKEGDKSDQDGKGARGKDAGPTDTMGKKITHDAAAYIRGLAQMRGRNAEWAERAVREAVSLSANEALEQKVIDYVAQDTADLLRQIDGKKLKVLAEDRKLETAGARVERVVPDWRTQVLALITDPNIAYILLLIGIYGLFFEFSNPGYVLPGVAGVICLLLALFAFQLMPVNYAGLALIVLGIAFMVAELFFPAFGSLGIGGIIAFVIGSVMLIDTDVPGYDIAWPVIGAVALASALFLFFVVGAALKARHRPVVSGREQMIGSVGEMLEDSAGEGLARVQGELWTVKSPVPLRAGQKVRVTAMDGLTLTVSPEEN